ncbi:MAG: 50S ribosomal protein L11 [Nanoarchaeota archaeon]|nr:50S ribosomal protein L11 [Nanoarchaeota archaeon]
MATEQVEVLIEGGKATAAPPLGPALGPLGVNIGKVVADINKKTADFKGMQVPVKVIVDKDTKEYTISIVTPPASQLLLKEAGIAKGTSNPKTDLVADVKIEQVIKIAKMKEDALLGKTMKEKVKEVVGTCQSMGIMVEGKRAQQTLKDISAGMYEEKIRLGKTEVTAEELKKLAEEKKKLQENIKTRHEEFMNKAKQIIANLAGKEKGTVKNALVDAMIPADIIKELLPEEEKKPAAGAPAKGGAPAKK